MSEDITPLQRPKLNLDFNSFVVVNGLPKISEDKRDKLATVLRNLLNKKNMQTDFTDVVINLEGQGMIKFVTEEKAILGARALFDFQLDPKHRIQTLSMREFFSILATPSQYQPLNLRSKRELE